MGLLDEIRDKRSRLSHTTTIVTTLAGEVFVEDVSSDGVRICGPSIREPGRCQGFVVDTKPDMDMAEIIPGLFLGSQDVTQEGDVLQKHGVTDIVSLGVEIPHLISPKVNYHFIPVLDLPETNLGGVCAIVLPLTHDLLTQNKVLFIHCNAGVSRSPSVVIAYLMKFRSMTFSDAFKLVKMKRPVINPNQGFIKQLSSMDIVCERK